MVIDTFIPRNPNNATDYTWIIYLNGVINTLLLNLN